MRKSESHEKATDSKRKVFDVVILGAGSSGIGTAVALHELGITNYLVLEKGAIGQSFLDWPKETRFITPSFTSNMFQIPDLNAVTPLTSPAFSSDAEHLSGPQYAQYLTLIANYYTLPIREHTRVVDVRKENKVFMLKDKKGDIYEAKMVIAALGEWNTPNANPFPGASFTKHTSEITSYAEIEGGRFVVIGSGESAFDFAHNMASLGKKVTMIDSGNALEAIQYQDDPSKKISPKTYQNFLSLQKKSLINFVTNSKVPEIKKDVHGYTIVLENGDSITSKTVPYLATGFKKLPEILESHVKVQKNGDLALNTYDESRVTKNLFIVGPTVHRENVILCFIYKFRMRFAVVACEIAKRLHKDADTIKSVRSHYRKYNMYLQNISRCDISCDC